MANGGSFDITTDPENSPKTVAHILSLVRSGFYDGQRVHRVESWVTQWGAPGSKTLPLMVKGKNGKMEVNEKVGDGGSGANISAFEAAPSVDFLRGTVGIASEGLQLPGDSQLFVLKADTMRLYRSYAVVGKVTRGWMSSTKSSLATASAPCELALLSGSIESGEPEGNKNVSHP